MQLSHKAFDELIAHDGPDVSISFYHECLHSIVFTHAKVLSIPHHKLINPDSTPADDGTITVGFILHWWGNFLLPLFTCLLHLHLKPQLQLSDDDYNHIISSFDDIPPSDIDDLMGQSLKHLGHHLHIIQSISILEQLCGWKTNDPPLDYFLHIGGTPMIIVGNILIWDDIQHTLTQLIEHVGSPSLTSMHLSSKLHSCSLKSQASISNHSSLGSCTGTRISFTTSPQVQMIVTLPTVPDSTPTIQPHINIQPLVSMPVTPSSPFFHHLSTTLHDIPEETAIPDTSTPAIS